MSFWIWVLTGMGAVVMYTLLWFLLSAFIFLVSRGRSPALKMITAFMFGIFSAVVHLLAMALFSNYLE